MLAKIIKKTGGNNTCKEFVIYKYNGNYNLKRRENYCRVVLLWVF